MRRDVSAEDCVSGPEEGFQVPVLNMLRSRMGSECKVFMRGDALSRLLAQKISLAALF